VQILFIGQQSLTSPSGLGRHWPLAKEVAALGHRVRIVTLHHDWANLEHPICVRENVEIVYVGQMQVLKRNGQKSYFSTRELLNVTWQSALALRIAIVQSLTEGFHTVHLMKPQPINGLAWLLTHRRVYRPRFFVDCDDYELGFVAQRGWTIRTLVDWFERQMPRLAQEVTVNTDHARRRLVAQGIAAETIHYLPNGVERSRFATRNEQLEAQLRHRYRSHTKPVIIYVGALNIHSHAVDLLIQSFRLAKEQIPDLHLLLIGSGPDRQKLEQLIASMALGDSVTFVGQVDPADVPSYLRIADLSVEATRSTSVAEGRFPLKVVESLAAGVPVVCGAVGDRIPTLQRKHQENAGLLVEPDDPYALADGICTVLRSPDLADQLRCAGLQRAEDFYWDHLAPAIVQMYSAHQLT
jgi:glycosyltransferase involved in cell wall biosynthesis